MPVPEVKPKRWTLVESPKIGNRRRMQVQVDGRVCGFLALDDQEHEDLERRVSPEPVFDLAKQQLVALALVTLAKERPGYVDALKECAARLGPNGPAYFDQLTEIHK